MNARRRLLGSLGLSILCGCSLPVAPTPAVQDLPGVFRRAIHLDEGITANGPDWKPGKLDKDALPRYPCLKPTVGDFALYSVHRTYRAHREVRETAAYLLLEVITMAREDRFTQSQGRVFGVSRSRWGDLIHKGVTNLDQSRDRHCHDSDPWPYGYLRTYDGSGLSVEDLSHFRNYSEFAVDKDVEVSRVAHRELARDPTWGRLHLFGVLYHIPQGVSAGHEHLIVSDRVPVRGLLYGHKDWSSSSGMHNHIEQVTLLNHGRLTPAERNILDTAQDVLPSEESLWKSLLWPSPRPRD